MKVVINSNRSLESAIETIRAEFDQHKYLNIDLKSGKTRTNKQNAAIHVFYSLTADALNDKGITFEQFFKEGFDLPWSDTIVKEYVWRVVQKALYGTVSTTNLERKQIDEIYDYINRKLGSLGIHVPFPANEDQ